MTDKQLEIRRRVPIWVYVAICVGGLLLPFLAGFIYALYA